MGRQSNDTAVRCSSIALLQERFRQLQRIKEMREEKRILLMIAEAEQPKWFFCHDLAHPPTPPGGSSSLQADYHVNYAETQSMEVDLGKLFIGGISWDTNEDSLRKYFSAFGEVVEAVIMKDRTTGRARGFGFVVFADPAVTERVVTEKHTIDGRMVTAWLLPSFFSTAR
ncbi:hypothetical protein GW17_00009600 [Ensete ventricosum]|nr:hypothetical protein GW17_00009600 [Ensete ventricosum]RZR86393.1 hypothetical protein BHM03_00013580 [Ensete ventricosum]